MRLPLGIIFAVVAVMPVLGDEVPFASPPPARSGAANDTNYSSLGDIMGLVQLRHIKLWYAGRNKNWQLVNYELTQIKDTFDKAAMLYMNIPVKYIASVEKPLLALHEAAEAKDVTKFAQGFADLQAACNTCHQAAQVGFIVIRTPTSSPFSDQNFVP